MEENKNTVRKRRSERNKRTERRVLNQKVEVKQKSRNRFDFEKYKKERMKKDDKIIGIVKSNYNPLVSFSNDLDTVMFIFLIFACITYYLKLEKNVFFFWLLFFITIAVVIGYKFIKIKQISSTFVVFYPNKIIVEKNFPFKERETFNLNSIKDVRYVNDSFYKMLGICEVHFKTDVRKLILNKEIVIMNLKKSKDSNDIDNLVSSFSDDLIKIIFKLNGKDVTKEELNILRKEMIKELKK